MNAWVTIDLCNHKKATLSEYKEAQNMALLSINI